MHKAYLGQKQFSIEGLDMTVPMLDELIQLSAARGAREVVIGMAHRGRLNVLAHNLGRPYDTIFAEFEGASTLEPSPRSRRAAPATSSTTTAPQGSYQLPGGESIIVRLESNPSHLEFVAPVVDGRHPRGPDHPPGPARPPRHRRGDPDHPPRRRRLPRPGRGRRDAQPPGARRLHGRRHDPPDPEQPGRLHDRPRRRALDHAGRPTWPRATTSRSSTSTPTTWPPASPPSGWPSPSARSSATTC